MMAQLMFPSPPVTSQAATQTAPAFGTKQQDVAVKLHVEGSTCPFMKCSKQQCRIKYLAQCKGDAGNLRRRIKASSTKASRCNTLSRLTSVKDDPWTDALHVTGHSPENG
jgi:hypothetical protein